MPAAPDYDRDSPRMLFKPITIRPRKTGHQRQYAAILAMFDDPAVPGCDHNI
jgi:hypothetical protein